MKTLLAVVTAATLLTSLTGCYKSDWEAEQKKSAALQGELDKAKTDLAKATNDARTAGDLVNRFRTGAALVSVVDGQRVQDGIVLTSENSFVKNGPRVRGINSVNYTMGALTDGPISLKREKHPDKNYVNGSVKANKAEGEWMWYDTAGKVTNRQVFANGKQVSVEAATVAKDGKVTWKKLDKAAADKFFDAHQIVFINIPELLWER